MSRQDIVLAALTPLRVSRYLSLVLPSLLARASDRNSLTLGLQDLLLVVPVLLFSVIAHEYAHGYAALKQGDTTALALGRLTWNPIKHIDPWMTLLLPGLLWIGSGGKMLLGGAK